MRWQEQDGIRWLEADLDGARALFSTRLGGVSRAPFDSLNLGLMTGDDPERIASNRHAFAAAAGIDPARVLMGRQVHGAELRWHDGPPAPAVYAGCLRSDDEADAQATAHRELAPLVLVADCLPVALAGPGGVAMAHGGWRGVAAGVLERAAAQVEATHAAIGPGIGPCCFEVGEEVLAAFPDAGDVSKGRMLDLPALAELLLRRAGVSAVERSELCTRCNPDLLFSHRRDGEGAGRQCGLVTGAGSA